MKIKTSIEDIRNISEKITLVTANQVAKEQNDSEFNINDIKSMMWKPSYRPLVKTAN